MQPKNLGINPWTLAFSDIYEQLVLDQKLTKTVRLIQLGSHRYAEGEPVSIVVKGKELARGVVTSVEVLPFREVTKAHLKGESPDCLTPETLGYALAKFYKGFDRDASFVQIVGFKYSPSAS